MYTQLGVITKGTVVEVRIVKVLSQSRFSLSDSDRNVKDPDKIHVTIFF